jgi:N-methylhydantoinase B
LFNYGPGIAALRDACEVQTGLPAPVQPVWPHLAAAE